MYMSILWSTKKLQNSQDLYKVADCNKNDIYFISYESFNRISINDIETASDYYKNHEIENNLFVDDIMNICLVNSEHELKIKGFQMIEFFITITLKN